MNKTLNSKTKSAGKVPSPPPRPSGSAHAGAVHHFGLRFESGSSVVVHITIPQRGEETKCWFRFRGTTTEADRGVYTVWRESVRREVAELAGFNIAFEDSQPSPEPT